MAFQPEVLNKSDFGPRLPPRSKYIGRGSPFGNEFRIGVDGSRDEVIDLYIAKHANDTAFLERVRQELAGFHLVCHCKPKRCHGDWLLSIANS